MFKDISFTIARALFLALGILVPPTLAAQVTFTFRGQVTSVTDPRGLLNSSVASGVDFTGSYTFDTSAPDLISSPNSGEYAYNSAPNGINVSVGSYIFENLAAPGYPRFEFCITNNFGGLDGYGVLGRSGNAASGQDITLFLLDPTMNALTSDTLPATPPDLAAFSEKNLYIRGFSGSQSYGILGTLTSLEAATEPATSIPERFNPALGLMVLGVFAGLHRVLSGGSSSQGMGKK